MSADGERQALEPRATALLALLLRAPGECVTREQIADALWDGIVSDDAITATIARLRRHLGDSAARSRYLQTLPGRGYRWVMPVASVDADAIAGAPSTPTRAPPRTARRIRRLALTAMLGVLFGAGALWQAPPTPRPELERARSLLARGDDAAILRARDLLVSLAREQQDAEAAAVLARLYSGKHRARLASTPAAAEVAAMEALALAQRHGASAAALRAVEAEIALQLRLDPVAALRALGDAADAPPDADTASLGLRARLALGQAEAALHSAEAALQRFPEADRLLWDAVLAAYVTRDLVAAERAIARAQAWGAAPNHWLLALVREAQQRPAEARAHWLAFFSPRAGYAAALPHYARAEPTAFAAFIAALDASGSGTCLDRALAAVALGARAAMMRELEACRRDAHPLALLAPHLPVFAAEG